MADVKLGEPFGMEASALAGLNLSLAVKRILNDLKSDFIYAPHINLVYARASEALCEIVTTALKAGQFAPGIPVSIEVPKSFRIPVESTKRLGPTYSRPGSILLPKDRLLYQALADRATGTISDALDCKRSFSHQLAGPDSPAMFLPTRKCWNDLQAAIVANSKPERIQYILKLDIADYFGSLNLHVLVNTLGDAGFPKAYWTRLEALLTSFTGQRSSRGILQGIYPSDLFGNFYLAPIDRLIADMGFKSARYVDDLYIFVESVEHADRFLRQLIPTLRSYDLSLNESKCRIIPKSLIHSMEPDLDSLFRAAVDEIASQVDEEDFDADYGFQSEWAGEDGGSLNSGHAGDDSSIELKATIALFESVGEYPGQEENVERFCLPLFSKTSSPHAVDHVKDAFKRRPAMAQIYCSYLGGFLESDSVRSFVNTLAADSSLLDWQRMWVLAAMNQIVKPTDSEVKLAWDIAGDGTRSDTLRAVAAYFVGRHGDYPRRTNLRTGYALMSGYIQAAIYASSRSWPSTERSNAKATWGAHGDLNTLLTAALKQ